MLTYGAVGSNQALAGLIADARQGRLTNKTVVFWLTYNSQPYPAETDTVSAADLPASFRHYLEA